MIKKLRAAWSIITGKPFLLATKHENGWRIINNYTPDEGVSTSSSGKGVAVYFN